MDKGLTVQKWVLINQPKVPQMPQNLFAQIVCPSAKVWYFDGKRLHWASVVVTIINYFIRLPDERVARGMVKGIPSCDDYNQPEPAQLTFPDPAAVM